MYELAYDIALNEDRSVILQPLFNASIVTTRMDGYRESGSAGNAGLKVEDQELTTAAVAVGARLSGLMGSNVFGREALGEVRVNVSQDMGDRRGQANVGFLADPGYTRPVYGAKVGSNAVVVKPVDGEQGQGVAVNLSTYDEVSQAIEHARRFDSRVLLESYHPGQDLRIVVIGYQVVAAAIRHPASVVGDGVHCIGALIEAQSRRRQAATGGESRIPLDAETQRTLHDAGYDYSSVLPAGTRLAVRKTANLHTGGTLEDVTARLHPALAEAAISAARALEIPVVGLDLLVPAADQPDYVLIEANERVGLANHEPQPTAERFIDLLFPLSRVHP